MSRWGDPGQDERYTNGLVPEPEPTEQDDRDYIARRLRFLRNLVWHYGQSKVTSRYLADVRRKAEQLQQVKRLSRAHAA